MPMGLRRFMVTGAVRFEGTCNFDSNGEGLSSTFGVRCIPIACGANWLPRYFRSITSPVTSIADSKAAPLRIAKINFPTLASESPFENFVQINLQIRQDGSVPFALALKNPRFSVTSIGAQYSDGKGVVGGVDDPVLCHARLFV